MYNPMNDVPHLHAGGTSAANANSVSTAVATAISTAIANALAAVGNAPAGKK